MSACHGLLKASEPTTNNARTGRLRRRDVCETTTGRRADACVREDGLPEVKNRAHVTSRTQVHVRDVARSAHDVRWDLRAAVQVACRVLSSLARKAAASSRPSRG